MDNSPRLALPYLAPQQAQKHVTVNETFRRLDALVHLSVASVSRTDEPASPAEGDAYILPAGLTGPVWASLAPGAIAAFQDGAWVEIAPGEGWRAWVSEASALYVYTNGSWQPVTSGGGREQLTADRTYFVNPAGDDANSGLSAASPLRTIQRAIDVVASIDIAVFNVTIQLSAGTYTAGGVVSGAWLGTGDVTLRGDTVEPANVIIRPPSGNAIVCENPGARLTVQGFRVEAPNGSAISAVAGGHLALNRLIFGPCRNRHIRASSGTITCFFATYEIDGGGEAHLSVDNLGFLNTFGTSATLTGTPNFTIGFASVQAISQLSTGSTTYTGAASGRRYFADRNSIVNSAGTSFPGSSAGTLATGAQFI